MERNEFRRVDATAQSVTRLATLFQRPAEIATALPDDDEATALTLEQERAEWFARAREEGHAEGMRAAEKAIHAAVSAARAECEAAHAQALAELEQARSRLSELLRRLPGMIDAIEDGALEAGAELAWTALLRMLGEVPAQERIVALCRQALREQQQRPIVIRVSPDDVEAVAGLADATSVRVEGDIRLQPGQCQLDTGLGIHDTGLDVRLDLLRDAFLRGIATARGSA